MSVASQLSYMMLYNNVTLQTLIRKHSSVSYETRTAVSLPAWQTDENQSKIKKLKTIALI